MESIKLFSIGTWQNYSISASAACVIMKKSGC